MWRVHIGARLIAALLGTLRILPLHWVATGWVADSIPSTIKHSL
jgi:hypothetical protein